MRAGDMANTVGTSAEYSCDSFEGTGCPRLATEVAASAGARAIRGIGSSH